MAPPVISRTLGLFFLIYLAPIVCGSSYAMTDRLLGNHLRERDTSTDYFENENYSSTDLSEYLNIESSGDYHYDFEFGDDENDKGLKPKVHHPHIIVASKNDTEATKIHQIKKIKFSNELEPDDNDFTIMSDVDSTTVQTTMSTTTTEQTKTVKQSTPFLTMSSPQQSTPFVPTSSLPEQFTRFTETTLASATTIQTSTVVETTTTTPRTSEGYNCMSQDCENTEVEIIPQHQSLLPGGNFSLLCKTKGNVSEPMQFDWYLEDENGRFKIADGKENRLVQEAKISNSGKYICIAVYNSEGCCEASATAIVVIYEKPAYWIHIVVLLGISLGLLLLVCVPLTLKLQRRYMRMEAFKERNAQDKEPLTV